MTTARVQTRVISDLVYSRAGGKDRLANIYLPHTQQSPLPAVIWLHGGGWRFGDRNLAPNLAEFAQQSGLAIVSIDYRLSDEAKFPAAVDDVKTAVRWVRSLAAQFGFDQDHVGLWGSSAGGHLAALAAITTEDEFQTAEHAGISSAVQAVVDGYGPMNFGRIDADRAATTSVGKDAESLAIGKVLPAGHPDSFESRFIGAPVATSRGQVELADPVHYMRRNCPPFLILHGESDTLIPSNQSRYLFNALQAAGNDATLVLFEKLTHGFFNDPKLAEENYGSVTVLKSNATTASTQCVCDAGTSIPVMVSGFFQAHLGT
jgi:acetyl esterase/lipase